VSPATSIPITPVPIATLKAHPDQAGLFADLPAHELDALVDDIRTQGLQHPVDVLPDGTIVRGHQRVRAYRELGLPEIPARVRHDWAGRDRVYTDVALVDDNLFRRHDDPLGRAKAYAYLFRKLKKLPVADRPEWCDGCDLRDAVGKRLGLSGRNLGRYLDALDAPAPVQEAFRRGAIKLVQAARVGNLPVARQNKIAEALEQGQDPKAVLRAHLPGPARKERTAHQASVRFAHNVLAALAALDGQEDEVAALGACKDDRDDLARAAALIARMLEVPARKVDGALETARLDLKLGALFKAAKKRAPAAGG
jgi:ParB family chromosome partitioning protein